MQGMSVNVQVSLHVSAHGEAALRAGPICGVIAAGLEYGDYCCYGSTYGERLRFAATYVSPPSHVYSCSFSVRPAVLPRISLQGDHAQIACNQ